MNRKRLAFSAAIVAGLLYPIWTESWAGFGRAIESFGVARWHDAEDAYFARAGTTRKEFKAKVYQDCVVADRRGSFDAKDSFPFSAQALHDSAFRACTQPAVVLEPEENLRSYGAGMLAAFLALWPWLADAFGAAAVVSLLAFFGPVVAGRYYQWVKAE